MFSFSFSFCFLFPFPFSLFCSWFVFVCFPFCLFLFCFCFCLSCLYSGPWSRLNAVKVKFSFSILFQIGCSRLSCVENAQPIKLQCNWENRTVRKVGKQYNSSQFVVVVVCLRFQFVKGGKSKEMQEMSYFLFFVFMNSSICDSRRQRFHGIPCMRVYVCVCVCDVSVCLARKSLHTSRRCGRNYLSNVPKCARVLQREK